MEACKFTKISLHNNSAETKKGKNMLYTLPDSIFMNISKKNCRAHVSFRIHGRTEQCNYNKDS